MCIFNDLVFIENHEFLMRDHIFPKSLKMEFMYMCLQTKLCWKYSQAVLS